MRKKPRFHGLKKTKIRQSWNKFNLYNLSRLQSPQFGQKTFFQQKWAAKSMTRAYHGEQMREKQWQRMFDTRIPSVQSMDHVYLAQNDGSEQATGRGSGVESKDRRRDTQKPMTPYMQMTYGPTERRLDTAIWRALFASSVRQARQFITHGQVKVNGRNMIYPGYQLNPGDMFQVEPDRVMFATGMMKNQDKKFQLSLRRRKLLAKKGESGEGSSEKKDNAAAAAAEAAETGEEEPNESESRSSESPKVKTKASTPETPPNTLPSSERQKIFKRLLLDAKQILLDPKDRLSAKRKTEWRNFHKLVRSTLSRFQSTSDQMTQELESQFDALKEKLSPPPPPPPSSVASSSSSSPSDQQQQQVTKHDPKTKEMSSTDETLLREALKRAYENPVDESKPYATPWVPRPYMSPFAFIPRYLEVNQNVCSAVYLRHPVARPGLAEVPTPFNYETSQLAFAWYLRRR
ncbi:MAG: mitochondrial 37S ribosomal protein nam9 [Bogoriella megaspora]|nr:MAG: mitochondrial 37S ribosomal protein nam9 [Bogoriella megaspora]